jgi:16S rRNA processing protein RimM
LSGAVKAESLSDVPHRFDIGQTLHVRGDPYVISSSVRASRSQVILKFRGIDSLARARGLLGEWMTVPRESVPALPEGGYFHFQLLGLQVFTRDGERLGRVCEILETGSNDVYVVSNDGGELLLPALADVIREIDLAQGVMVVDLPDGLR